MPNPSRICWTSAILGGVCFRPKLQYPLTSLLQCVVIGSACWFAFRPVPPLYNITPVHDSIAQMQTIIIVLLELRMGADCANVRMQVPSPNRVSSSRTIPLAETTQEPRVPEVFINVYTPLDQEHQKTSQHLPLVHRKKLDPLTSDFKFVENVGFFDGHSQISKKQAQHQLYFQAHKTEQGNYLIELIRKPGTYLWRKVKTEGIILDQKDLMWIGDSTLKLIYWLTPEETLKMSNKSKIKLKICQDQYAECRFCLESSKPDDPLLEPCSCIGSVSAIHQRCLSKWIFDNPGMFEQKMKVFWVRVKKWRCQICKTDFNQYIWNRILTITTVFSAHYAIFQVKPSQQITNEEGPQFLILKFNSHEQILRIGNRMDCDLVTRNKKQDFLATLSLTAEGLTLQSHSKAVPLIETPSNYLIYKEEYKNEQFHFWVCKS